MIYLEIANCLHRVSRCNHQVGDPKEVSPIIDQLLECVWQLTEQFPCVFEFNERFLITIHSHIYSCQYGNFIGNNQRDRIELGWDLHLQPPSVSFPFHRTDMSADIQQPAVEYGLMHTETTLCNKHFCLLSLIMFWSWLFCPDCTFTDCLRGLTRCGVIFGKIRQTTSTLCTGLDTATSRGYSSHRLPPTVLSRLL